MDPGALERAAADRALRGIYRQHRVAMAAQVVLSAYLAVDPLRPGLERPLLLWWALGVGVAAVRLWKAGRFLRTPAPEREAAHRRWELGLVLGAGASSLFWSVGIALLERGGDPGQRAFLAFAVAGVLAAALGLLAGSAAAFAAMVVPVTVTFELLLVPRAVNSHDWTMAVAAPLYALTLVGASAQISRRIRANLRLVLEQKELVAELRAAHDAAHASAEARARFAAVVSHEVRTPLAGVAGLTRLLLDTPLGPEQREYARGVQQSAEALLVLVNDVLDLSKMDAGKMELERRPFSPRAELETLAGLMRFKAREKGLELGLALAPGVPERARGDWPRLRQVLVNLLGNAIKFTERGAVRLEVEAHPGPAGGWRLEVRVVDSGIGIAPEEQGRLFQPFEQAAGAGALRGAGTGLGLHLSRRLVELLGGALALESAPGKGSTFSFSLPLEPEDAPAPAPAATSPRSSPAEVLVVEDNELNLLVARRLLERAGHRVSEARTGVEALRSLEGARFDVVLLDLHLPELDGWSTARRLRSGPGGPNQQVPLIALSASASAEDQRACLAAGFSDYLTKPVTPEALCAAVERWAARGALG